MNIAYYYEFKGLDNALNRVEILTADSVTTKEVIGTGTPFVLNYTDVRKLEPIQGAGATLGMVSHEIFEFISLHTDDMQKYMIRFYRGGSLYWMGWLDPELYDEQLSDYPPYPVEFTAADFNVLERLKYKDANDKNYNDIVTMKEHLKRCLSLLGLPFGKVYIGCSTTAEGITLSASETVLDKLYVLSANFYDEDDEPMSCREVIESILQPFGLMMVQRDANVYIYDYNTVADGLPMKRYNYASWDYEADETPAFNIGDLKAIGFRGTGGQYGFETMYNNVTITSSLYANTSLVDASVNETNLSNKKDEQSNENYTIEYYASCKGWKDRAFILMRDKNTDNTLIGANFVYSGEETERNNIVFENNVNVIIPSNVAFIRLKCRAYVNTKNNPFDYNEQPEEPDTSRRMQLFYKLILTRDGEDIMYFNGVQWVPVSENGNSDYAIMVFLENVNWRDSRVLNQWLTNSNVHYTGATQPNVVIQKEKDFQAGTRIPIPPESGFLKLIIDYALIDDNSDFQIAFKNVKNMLIDSVSLTFEDVDGNEISTDDYEFKSYVNKKVKSDFDEITLKCISANEEKAPIGKANILKKNGDSYDLQLAYTRSGQTDILERLLMCTIHSNYSQKNEQFGCTVKLKGNPVMGYVTYSSILDGSYLVTGAEMDFRQASMTLSCVGYSKDTAKLSSIPYE